MDISILVYGFFHETFKMSQGAFILAFVLGMMVTANRYKTIGKNRQATFRLKIKKKFLKY